MVWAVSMTRSVRLAPLRWARFSSILLVVWGAVAAAQAEEDARIEGVDYGPECLNVRAYDHECVRDLQGAPWRCSNEAHLDLKNFGLGICLTWAKDPRPACECGKHCGPGFREPPSMTTTDPETGAEKTTCDLAPLKREPETVAEMPAKYAQKVSFALPREKFPQCLVARIQTHECSRVSDDSDWKCEQRPRLRDPTAICFVWSNWNYPCATNPGWPIIGYVTTNIDPTSHATEPVLHCAYDHSGAQISGEIHTIFPYAPPDWNKPPQQVNDPRNWRSLAGGAAVPMNLGAAHRWDFPMGSPSSPSP